MLVMSVIGVIGLLLVITSVAVLSRKPKPKPAIEYFWSQEALNERLAEIETNRMQELEAAGSNRTIDTINHHWDAVAEQCKLREAE